MEEDGGGGGGGEGDGAEKGIKVFLRIKPTRIPSGYLVTDDDDPCRIEVDVPLEDVRVNNTKTSHKFRFNGIFSQEADQEDIFERVAKNVVLSAMDGFNATIFAYGQTGSGKTFTMTGGPDRYEDRGIIPRALSMIFDQIEKRSDVQFTTHISYLEIYNNMGYDLLDQNQESRMMEDLSKVTLMEDDDGNVHLRNLSMHPVSNEEDALNLLFVGDTNRAISETPMNLASSRSHCIFTVSMEMRQSGSDVIRTSKLHLVDLAGSERVHKTDSNGQILREAKHINSSLHFLEMVIVALHERVSKGRMHIPYRNSMMTSVLRDSLGGNCKTCMIATVSAEKSNTEESISTCRFAQRVALVQNAALVNEEIDPTLLIKRLKGEVAALKEELAFLKGDRSEDEASQEIDSYEMKRLERVVADWIETTKGLKETKTDGSSSIEKLQPGPLTFHRIHACFFILRRFAQTTELPKSESELIEDLKQQIVDRDGEITTLMNMMQPGTDIPEVKKQIRGNTDASKKQDDLYQDETPSSNNPSVVPREVLEDKQSAFEYFKETYPQKRSIEDHKQLLKEKYTHAKEAGERVNAIRDEITALKQDIETLRTQTALQGVVEGKEIDDPEIENKMDQMTSCKAEYKQYFQELKELKKEIERIQGFLGNARSKMQRDFESWFKIMVRQAAASSLEASNTVSESKHSEPVRHIRAKEESHDVASTLMTGNQEADEDIMAFYKAKELLMRRSKHK